MTASAEARPPPTALNAHLDSRVKLKLDGLDGHLPGQLRRHKLLPHPRGERVYGSNGAIVVPRSRPVKLDLDAMANTLSKASVTQRSSSQPSISSVSLRRTQRVVPGPDPPPTPPAHSRTSSSGHSALPSSLTHVAAPFQGTNRVDVSPVTPTNQQSPPTPNLTPERSPPAPALTEQRPRARPVANDRIPSKMSTVTDTRTESFRTAKESLESSEGEDGESTSRPVLPSTHSSYSTVRQVTTDLEKKHRHMVGLGLGLESSQEDITPTKGEFSKFDGGWASGEHVEAEWDENLMRNVTIRKRRRGPVPMGKNGNGETNEVVEDLTVTPTNATKALRSSSLALQESPIVYPTRRIFSDSIKPSVAAAGRPISQSSINMDVRRVSGTSTSSTVSTVVEAILVEKPSQRRQTLRHVRKQSGLRESLTDMSVTPSSSVSSSLPVSDAQKRIITTNGVRSDTRARHASLDSNTTQNSISSRRARREIQKKGGIPVVVIPERRSSTKSSKEPSLRSTSSRRSKRSQSLGSAGPVSQQSRSMERAPIFERPGRLNRTYSDSDGSRRGDQRTMDFPPVIPTRSSSRSAPTSHNASRSASLTAASLRAHNALQAERARKALESLPTEGFKDPRQEPKSTVKEKTGSSAQGARERQGSAKTFETQTLSPEVSREKHRHSEKDSHRTSPHVDRHGDPFFGERLSVQKTPFSLASVDTNGTSPEVSEALAMNIYPHQNKSVLVVDHSNRPSENSSLESKRQSEGSSTEQRRRYSLHDNPVIKATAPDSDIPVTPPQPLSMGDVDSPLRNPRAPPEPPLGMPVMPAIQFIPATPSGLTPMRDRERQMGNYFEEVVEKPKPKPMSLLRRTLTRRRFSEYGPSSPFGPGILSRPSMLARTFSLSRAPRRESADYFDYSAREQVYPSRDDRPREVHKLHPFWRPAHPELYPDHYGSHSESDSESDSEDDEYYTPREETYHYPPVDNRPMPPRRSLSARVKQTFAILPTSKAQYHVYDERDGATAQRTIRRTPSGNLRVVQHRRSLDSLRHYYSRPYTSEGASMGGLGRPGLWRTYSLSRTLSSKIEKIGSLPRRLSERRREKRSQELRRMISGPTEVRDGVGDVIRRNGPRGAYTDRW